MRLLALITLAAALAACSTPQSRIQRSQLLFDSYPPRVQQLIRKGEVDIGFTMEQARMALGRPDQIITEKAIGSTRQVWAYGGGASNVGFGFGMFSGGPTALGTSVDINAVALEARLRLTFENGEITDIARRSW